MTGSKATNKDCEWQVRQKKCYVNLCKRKNKKLEFCWTGTRETTRCLSKVELNKALIKLIILNNHNNDKK